MASYTNNRLSLGQEDRDYKILIDLKANTHLKPRFDHDTEDSRKPLANVQYIIAMDKCGALKPYAQSHTDFYISDGQAPLKNFRGIISAVKNPRRTTICSYRGSSATAISSLNIQDNAKHLELDESDLSLLNHHRRSDRKPKKGLPSGVALNPQDAERRQQQRQARENTFWEDLDQLESPEKVKNHIERFLIRHQYWQQRVLVPTDKAIHTFPSSAYHNIPEHRRVPQPEEPHFAHRVRPNHHRITQTSQRYQAYQNVPPGHRKDNVRLVDYPRRKFHVFPFERQDKTSRQNEADQAHQKTSKQAGQILQERPEAARQDHRPSRNQSLRTTASPSSTDLRSQDGQNALSPTRERPVQNECCPGGGCLPKSGCFSWMGRSRGANQRRSPVLPPDNTPNQQDTIKRQKAKERWQAREKAFWDYAEKSLRDPSDKHPADLKEERINRIKDLQASKEVETSGAPNVIQLEMKTATNSGQPGCLPWSKVFTKFFTKKSHHRRQQHRRRAHPTSCSINRSHQDAFIGRRSTSDAEDIFPRPDSPRRSNLRTHTDSSSHKGTAHSHHAETQNNPGPQLSEGHNRHHELVNVRKSQKMGRTCPKV